MWLDACRHCFRCHSLWIDSFKRFKFDLCPNDRLPKINKLIALHRLKNSTELIWPLHSRFGDNIVREYNWYILFISLRSSSRVCWAMFIITFNQMQDGGNSSQQTLVIVIYPVCSALSSPAGPRRCPCALAMNEIIADDTSPLGKCFVNKLSQKLKTIIQWKQCSLLQPSQRTCKSIQLE